MFRKLTIILVLALLCNTALAQNSYHGIQIVDERGVKVTDITSVEIYLPNTTTDAVIYSDRALQNTITIPMTTGSTNTTLVNGFISWYGADGYDFSITDGTNIATNSGHRTRTSSEGTLVFPSYLTSITTSQYLDAESITMGTSSDWVMNAGATPDLLTWTPATDGAIFRIGLADGSKSGNFQVYTASGVGLLIDESGNTFGITGLTANINVSSNFATNICTGTSTGATTIGNSAGGAVVIDSDTTISINSDTTLSISSTDAGANINIDAVLGSILIDSGENAALAISLITNTGSTETIRIKNTQGTSVTEGAAAIELLAIAGGVELRSTANLANAVALTVDGGTTSSILIFNDTGISATDGSASLQITSDLGGIELLSGLAAANAIRLNATGTVAGNALVLETTDAGILLNADGGSNGKIELNSAEDMTFTVAGDLTFAVTGATVLPNDILLKTTTVITDIQMDNLAGTQIELVAAVVGSTIEFVSAIFALDWVSVAWLEPSAPDDLVIRYTNGTGAIVSQLLDATGFATATADTTAFIGPNVANEAGAAVASVAVLQSASENQALVLDNTGAEWTNSGDSQVVVIVYYRLHTTAELGL